MESGPARCRRYGKGHTVKHERNQASAVVDPQEALRRAREAGLVVHDEDPLNCETPIHVLAENTAVTPNSRFYLRNHFSIPRLEPATFRLTVDGLVERPLSLSLDDLHRMPSRTLTGVLECAGNGRTSFRQRVSGEPWYLGAAGNAEWTGVLLREVLEGSSIRENALEALFRGADRGSLDGHSVTVRYERSLPLDEARRTRCLLAYGMNGEPLPVEHGYPLRLVVADWYGMASVKWLTEIELIGYRFTGLYQAEEYCYEWECGDQVVREPATLQGVRALITDPAADRELPRGKLGIRGLVWSGSAPIARVEVSIGSEPWQDAKLIGKSKPHTWQCWEFMSRVVNPGPLTLRARATDLAGNTQPESAKWNRRGYGNNSVHNVRVVIC
jgi:DMSO/TMAO reductase YedYZ molybdopterin-dependent catalytic subunit